jgi:hypothetical protein
MQVRLPARRLFDPHILAVDVGEHPKGSLNRSFRGCVVREAKRTDSEAVRPAFGEAPNRTASEDGDSRISSRSTVKSVRHEVPFASEDEGARLAPNPLA